VSVEVAEQLVSLVGAGLILAAYAAQQMEKLSPNSFLYLSSNFIGALILGVIAFRARQTGLTLVEAAWSVISFIALIKLLRKR